MRISTTWQHQLGVSQMLNQQTKLSETQLKMTTGKKYLTPSENPQAAASLIDFNQRIELIEQHQSNIGVVRQRLVQEDSGIDSGIEILQQVRDLTIQGLNDSNRGANRQQIADEIDQLKKQLLTIANTQNPNGEYIFSGYASDKPPFDSTYAYQGGAQRSLAIGESRTITDGDRGEDVFGAHAASPTVGSISNVFQAMEQLVADFNANTPNKASLTDLDNALERMSTAQVSIGSRLKVLDAQESLNEDFIIDHKTIVSEIGDLDYAEAISKFNLQQISLQAAQQAYVKVQGLSLFNYL